MRELNKHDDMFVIVEDEDKNEFVITGIRIVNSGCDGLVPHFHISTRKADGICLKR